MIGDSVEVASEPFAIDGRSARRWCPEEELFEIGWSGHTRDMSITWGLFNLAPLAVPPLVLLASSIISATTHAKTQRAAWMRATPAPHDRHRRRHQRRGQRPHAA
ncbi:MAG: hypothetical protein AB8G14_03895 [Ilumatobacter sp.]